MPELRAVAVFVLTVLVLTGSGCSHPVMVADAGSKPPEPAGTISGHLQTPGGHRAAVPGSDGQHGRLHAEGTAG